MGRLSEFGSVSIPVDDTFVEGDLTIPTDGNALVIFAHGSGSSRQSPRNKYVAEILNRSGIATLLIDLLTVEEEVVDNETAELRFNVDLLASRLIAATDWAREQRNLSNLRLGYFGASTGAAAALVAAARRPQTVSAVVSRGGRLDLARDALGEVAAPTLLIVGGYDRQVIELNRQAAQMMRAPVEIIIIPGASHMFEEPGALEQVALLARQWFEEKLIRMQAA